MDFPQNMGPFRHLLFGLAALLATTAMQMPKAAIAQSNAIKNASDPTGLKVTTTYDPAKNTANIVATNISGKDVTAYDLSVDVSYEGDIKDHHELMIDRLNLMINQVELGKGNPVAFPPGTTHEEPFFPGTIPDHKVLNVIVTVDLVVYADRSIESNNSDALQRLVNARTAHGSAMGEGLAVIKKILASGKENPSATALRELEMFHSAPISKDGGMQISRENELKSMIDDLERFSQAAADHKLPNSERDYLKNYIATKTQRMALTLAHANLKKGGQ